MEKVIFDFYNDKQENWLSCFCDYFMLEKEKVKSYFNTVNPDILTPNKFVIDWQLNLCDYDSKEVGITCRHMTTVGNEGIASFQSIGLLDLRNMLQMDTPLSQFLLEQGISVNVDNRKMFIDGNEYPITSYGEQCKRCMKNKSVICSGYSKCELREKLDHLGLKLYKYGATVEFFIHASIEQIGRYSTICRCPEILTTLGHIVEKATNRYSASHDLCYTWMNNNKQCYILEFVAKLSNMETLSPIDWRAAYDDCKEGITLSGYDYSDYMDKRVPQGVLDNIIFLRWFFSIYFYDSEVLGSLLPNKGIASSNIKFIEVRS